jgi:osmotically-inducible protein OsmY
MNVIKRNAVLGIALVLFGTAVVAADDFEGAARDAWIAGKIETVYLLNGHLNGFRIDTEVEGGVAHLSGTVKTDIDRDLAVELAKGVDGVVEVRNDLQIDADVEPMESQAVSDEDQRSFGTWIDDATTTAAVKAKLVGNENVSGLQLDVDTRGDVVTLSGRVNTAEQKSLAEEIARNTGDVSEVRNNLVVDAQ